MTPRPLTVCLVGSIVLAISGPLPAQRFSVAGVDKDSEVVAFLTTLQAAVTRGDSGAVTALMQYPLSVNDSAQHHSITTATQFLKRYSHIITSSVRHAILVQRPESLFANWQGVMIGNGQVWFGRQCPKDRPVECERLSVYAINRDAPIVR